MERVVLGIDPGMSGNVTAITESRRLEYFNFTKQSDLKIRNWLWHATFNRIVSLVLIERVSARRGDTPKTAAGLMGADRAVKMCLTCIAVEYETVESKAWQYEFNLGGPQGPPGCSEDEEYDARKEAHYQKALTLFSDKITKTGADGALIAEYAWRKTFGELQDVQTTYDGLRRGTGVIGISAPRVR